MFYFQSCLQGSNLLNLSLKNEASLVAQMVKNLPAKQEILGWEDPLEKGMATHSSILAWKNPWTEEPGGYSPWGRKEQDMTERPALSLPALKSHHSAGR